jgi:hypothetical protein
LSGIIDSYEKSPGTGIPIGNLTSQFFANVYLNAFEHYVQDVPRIPAYLRYMDDFCIFAGEKELLQRHKPVMEQFLRDTLKPETKPIYFLSPWRQIA